MSGSRQPSRSRLAPSVGHSPADSRHGSPYSRAGGSGHGIVPPNYSQPPVTQPIVASSTDTISSDPGTYPSASSHQTSSDYTSTLVSSPATLDTILSRGNDSWSDQNVLGSMGWENSEAWIEYSELTFPHEQFSTWQQPPQDQEWRLERSATAPIPTTNDNSPALSPIATQATVGYRRQQPPRLASPLLSRAWTQPQKFLTLLSIAILRSQARSNSPLRRFHPIDLVLRKRMLQDLRQRKVALPQPNNR